ncbi:unnamed protein product [Vitrella brassicaformis CCMP3155]|uniref:Uncharacterized protein n=1 Tax=Vitrella brassicaformis (strain CCMP3155) TaxID=1169540 RepID=A0A0G4EMM1_VITBC|nr:unnamed protein product [Vitrella brassicaformis CCMP3155]|eukprot:CEL98058.1 unnamed protein product [Vitrella brassicaformis CCMP3155]
MAQREHQRAPERRQRQESVLRQGESRPQLQWPIEEQRRQVAEQLQLQRGGRQGRAELPARVATREMEDYGPRYVPDETVDAAAFLDGTIAGGLPASVRRTQYQGSNQRNGADLFSEYTQVRGGVGYGRLTGRDDDVRGGYGDGHMTGHPYQYTASYRYEMSREGQQYGSGRLTWTGQDDAYGGAPPSTRPHRCDGRLPQYSQHQTNHGLSRDEVGAQPESHYASRLAYPAPNISSFVRKRPVVSRGIQCSIMTTQTPLGPQRTRGASRHHQQHQQQVEAMTSSVGRHPPPPDSNDTYNRQNSGSGGLFGGMFLGLGSLLGGGRASGAVREETQELPLNRRTNRRHIDDDRYAYGAQWGGSYESRYYQQEPLIDRRQEVEAYARELDNWKGFWEMELQERSEIQERLRQQHEERATEREKRMERLHRQQQQTMEREWREVEAKKDQMRRKEQELEEKQKQIGQQLQHQMQQLQCQQQQRLNSDNETADNQQPSSASDTVPPTPTGAVQEAPRVAEGDASGERQRARQMLQKLESKLHFKNPAVPSAPGGGRPHEV